MKNFFTQNKYIFIFAIGFFIIVASVFFYIARTHNSENNTVNVVSVSENINNIEKKEVTNSLAKEKSVATNTQHFILGIGDERLTINFKAGETLYDAMMRARGENIISFIGRDYYGLGFFVSDIGNLHQGNGKYLFYFINNEEAMIGISSYVLKDGDVILWKLK